MVQILDKSTMTVEGLVSVGLVSTPAWSYWLHDFNVIFGTIATICGAIIGVHAVYRMFRELQRKGRVEMAVETEISPIITEALKLAKELLNAHKGADMPEVQQTGSEGRNAE